MLGFGTYRLQGHDATNCVKTALKTGYRYIDTAALYKNEIDVGKGICESKIPREEIFITTKVQKFDLIGDPEIIIKSVDKSLENLQTEYLDCVLLHTPTSEELDTIHWDAMCGLNKTTIKNIGVSNYNIRQLRKIMECSGITPFTNQIEVSPFLQRQSLIDFMMDNKILVTGYAPLTGGEKLNHPIITEVSKKLDATPAQTLIAWSLQHKYMAIPKSKTDLRIVENYGATNIVIPDELMDAINQIDEVYSCYPKLLNDDK
jgi:diketogulonate reductase-like aldo/keto reductase